MLGQKREDLEEGTCSARPAHCGQPVPRICRFGGIRWSNEPYAQDVRRDYYRLGRIPGD
jgi:hypothetical protein